jgi:hypothetical protein
MNMSVENIDNNCDKHLLPDTVIVKRISKKNKIKESEEWFSGISKEVSRQGGSMGIDLVCFSGDSSLTDVIGFRFGLTFIFALIIMSSSPTVVLFNPALVEK